MKITVLVENTTINKKYKSEHGWSLFVQIAEHNILFDMGATSAFAENSQALGVDLSTVDIAFLSHGHYDHGGGLKEFLKSNNTAKVYVNKLAFGEHLAYRKDGTIEYIGLDQSLSNNDRLILVEDNKKINSMLEILYSKNISDGNIGFNDHLYLQKDGHMQPDDFAHEQSLIVESDGKSLLIVGCAHSGIVNIVQSYFDAKGNYPDAVIGGFHLDGSSQNKFLSQEQLKKLAQKLQNGKTIYYTGHCTGEYAYNILKKQMKENVHKVSTGQEIII